MNRGSIPGYYFDEEKKKYFKIQPNHKAPANAKYSKSNATREQKESKRRRIEDHKRQVLHSQTVVRSRLQDDPLIGGTGLLREHGSLPYSTFAGQQGLAVTQGLGGSVVCRINFPGMDRALFDIHHFRGHTATTVAHDNYASICIYQRYQKQTIKESIVTEQLSRSAVLAFDERPVSTCTTVIAETPFIVGCSSGFETATLWYTNVIDADAQSFSWGVPSLITDCAMNQKTHDYAFSGASLVAVRSVLDQTKECGFRLPQNVEGSAVEWIDANIVAFGSSRSVYGKKQKVTRDHALMLWDIRVNPDKGANGTAPRLASRRRITGIERPDDSGNNVVVTTNHSIDLHDLRNLRKDQPVLSFDHQSEGMKTYTSTYNGDLLAAIDERQHVKVYSLRSGKLLRTLANQRSGLMRNVRWFEDEHNSPSLQACCGDAVQIWGFSAHSIAQAAQRSTDVFPLSFDSSGLSFFDCTFGFTHSSSAFVYYLSMNNYRSLDLPFPSIKRQYSTDTHLCGRP
ncbi:unnamed protein product [Zymoseptoria tritici ST99CH_1A5]|uniref:Uncharacterized protein n=1 Tax=Zymoseptoria tritici ST99CH_1A5 TaxID=1276529 RepID=A0A1Y6LC97_ZYMTR|nr:unnamed protein product [Zymoseptoria tritici ST99CH_3D1]SMY21925.1 unnamed protein product [Zymoseptoria tritici ST99CH_1A5]